jgi:hypothetical protein
VSDVKKEEELARKRKNDPALNQSQDHIVRKLFSKFKKIPTSSDMTSMLGSRDRDPEKVFRCFGILVFWYLVCKNLAFLIPTP